ncbi:class I poly(R)-hydroxyalkanoic acid synthase [Jiella sp. MQZ9-1]|uniref:Class I poly(R)-hydroxyalkanoic acid synthase n=1 Tax=Jiella flava TaxID=2816857 RepID=A0A939JWY9_9HYPH|nr:class I poly(R)-hydroxyalkanoic acid synthase [Jiella flava]MBO0662811.1 class I poly(R)-hydroxyalkanoic acid synthase [Jiella flava]MCD2471232.1 class I poly(R)-hydroxyalkanoic acid synthase [Jiella flava]
MSTKANKPDADSFEGPAADEFMVKDPEAFARNMARMLEQIGKAAAAWVAPREKGEFVDGGPVQMSEIVRTLSRVSEYWMTDPARAMEAQTNLFASYLSVWSNSIRRLAGEDAMHPVDSDKGDKRFAGEDWNNHLFFDFIKQAYLLTTRWADDLVERAEGLDPHTRHKAAFYVRQISNALAPSNFVMTNPELYRETLASNGENLVKGMTIFAEDMAAGNGNLRLRQSDYTKYEVGRDMAVTAGKVVAQNEVCQIIQYAAQTETVFKRPLLIVPPWINKFYILDLNPEKSLINWLVQQGLTVFVVSWVNPDERHADKDWQAYIEEGIVFGLDTAEKATGVNEINIVGYCVGGTLLGASLAYLKAKGDERIQSTTFLTTQIDFTHAGDLKVFVDEAQLDSLERAMEQRGYLDGSQMATAFNLLRSGDLIWPYFVNNYLRGKEPLPFDLLYWNADSTRMPKANHLFYLRNCYWENRLSRGCMEIGGVRLDLSKVTMPIYNLATKDDHIAPARSVFLGSAAFGSQVEFVLTGSGHIAGVVNPPVKNKYQFWTGPAPKEAGGFEDWLLAAKETPGSWWEHWLAWLTPLSGDQVKARKPGGRRLKPIEDAPGSYVKAKA